MEKLITNATLKVRQAKLQGRDYLVAPASVIKPGVWPGSAGPIAYGETEIRNSAKSWDARPLYIEHPKNASGQLASGCTAESLDSASIGMILNTKYNTKSKKLQTEVWFDVQRLQEVAGGDTVHAALLANQQLEVSTGLTAQVAIENGTMDGKDYSAKVTSIVPDHLAIILSGEGACSIKDGAGLLVNKSTKQTRPERLPTLVGNAKSLLDQVQGVREALYAKYEVFRDNAPSTYVYVEEIYDSSVIFELSTGPEDQYFKQNYEITDGEVTLLGELMPVAKKVSYQVQNKKQEKMERKDLISKLGDSHAEFVANMSEDQFKAVEKALTPVSVPAKAETLVVNSLDKLLALADAGLANQVKDAMTAAESARASLIETIVANSASEFTKDELAGFSTVHLNKMAKAIVPASAPSKSPVYAGSAFVGNQKNEPVTETGFGAPSTY